LGWIPVAFGLMGAFALLIAAVRLIRESRLAVRGSLSEIDHIRTVVARKTTADFRRRLPRNRQFFGIYAKGTYENSPRFGARQYTGMPGRYLFLLSGGFDTTPLPNGTYAVSVRVADVRGNHSTRTERISILNAKGGACPVSLSRSAGKP